MSENNVNANGGEELPKIKLPGDEKFISYKNSLQCYCQKKYSRIPLYKAERESDGLIGTVTINGETIRCQDVAESQKEADARAAFQALTQFGYLKGLSFEMKANQQKRKAEGEENQQPAPKRKPNGEELLSKSQLNELAQKKKFSLPTYTSEFVEGGYTCTVTFNGNQFKSLSLCAKRKDAEHNAAQVALHAVIGAPLPHPEPAPEVGTERPPTNGQPVSFKNRLQEYCQKQRALLPSYTTTDMGDKSYQTVVSVKGVEYKGNVVKGKKASESSAAEMALNALKLMIP